MTHSNFQVVAQIKKGSYDKKKPTDKANTTRQMKKKTIKQLQS